jgi:sugar phosphate permease
MQFHNVKNRRVAQSTDHTRRLTSHSDPSRTAQQTSAEELDQMRGTARTTTQIRTVKHPGGDPSLKQALLHRVRGKVLLLLCFMYMITYIDRVNISTAAPFIKDDLGLSNTQLGLALSAFAIPYAFFQIFGGMIGDRFGPRKVLGIVGLMWGVSTIATGFVTGLVTLFAARLALGFGEGASFPTATHAMAKWLPVERRAFGQGITHSFSRLGNALAPLMIAGLISLWGWRESFWLVGAISLVWVFFWVRYFRDNPKDHPQMTQEELDELPAYQTAESDEPKEKVNWPLLLRRVLPVTFIDFCYGWSLWVYLTWIPSFFADEYDLKLAKFALFTTLVLIAGVVGDTVGGLVSDGLLRRTQNLRFARRSVLVVGLLGSFAFIVPTLLVKDLVVVTVCLALAFFFLELCNSVLWAIPMDIAPRHAGTAGGLMNTGFGVAGILSPFTFGLLLDQTGHWLVPFGLSAALLFVGAMLALRVNPRPIDVDPELVDSVA